MKRYDFSVPRRMSKSAYVILFVKSVKGWFNITVIFLLYTLFASDEYTYLDKVLYVLSGLLAIVLFAAFTSFLKYYFMKFHVEEGNLIFQHGVFSKEVTNMPLKRIHSLRTKQGLIYRLLDMKGITFDTLASRSEEVEMVLDVKDWEALMGQIDALKADEAAENVDDVADTSQEEMKGSTTLMKISNLNLVKGAFCQNHFKGMAIMLALVGTLFNEFASVDKETAEAFLDYYDVYADPSRYTVTEMVVMALVLYLVMMLLWMGKVFLRYYNTEIDIDRDQLNFECGLFTRNSSRFSYDKVCTVHVKQNILERLLHCSTIVLKQALNATDAKEGSDVKLYGSQSAGSFLNWWLKDYASSPELASASSGYGMMGMSLQPKALIALGITVVFCHFDLYEILWLPIVYFLTMVVADYLAMRRSRIVLKQDYVEVYSGGFSAVIDYFKYSNVEVVRLKGTPFTPIYHRVSLHIDTNGSTFVIPSLKEEEAKEIYEYLLQRCEQHV